MTPYFGLVVGLAIGIGLFTFSYAEGGSCFSNDPPACVTHHVRSPLLDVAASCQTCHREGEDDLLARAETIQDRHARLRDRALVSLVDLIDDLKAAIALGVDEGILDQAREWQRRASFYVDFVEAENSTGFHAHQEAARILAESIDASRQGQLVLAKR